MSENIPSRVSRIISATANMLVDAVENAAPEMVMEEAIREIDRTINDVRAELGKVIARQHIAGRRLAEEGRKHEDLNEKVQLALKEKREDLAETAVAQLIDIEAQIPILESTISETKDAQAELQRYVSALQGRKREMREELAQFREAQKSRGSGDGSSDGTAAAGGDVDASVRRAEEAFARVMEDATGMAGGRPMADRAAAAQQAELDELARKNRIRERLAAFKTEDA